MLGKYQKYAVDVTDSTPTESIERLHKAFEKNPEVVLDGSACIYVMIAEGTAYLVGMNGPNKKRYHVLFSNQQYQGHNKFPSARLVSLVFQKSVKRYLLALPKEFKTLRQFELAVQGELNFSQKTNIEKFKELVARRVKALSRYNGPVVQKIFTPELIAYLGRMIGAQSFGEYADLTLQSFVDYRGDDKQLRTALSLLFGLEIEDIIEPDSGEKNQDKSMKRGALRNAKDIDLKRYLGGRQRSLFEQVLRDIVK